MHGSSTVLQQLLYTFVMLRCSNSQPSTSRDGMYEPEQQQQQQERSSKSSSNGSKQGTIRPSSDPGASRNPAPPRASTRHSLDQRIANKPGGPRKSLAEGTWLGSTGSNTIYSGQEFPAESANQQQHGSRSSPMQSTLARVVSAASGMGTSGR